MDFTEKTASYWSKGYYSPNVDSYVFRFYGRILKPEFNLPKPNLKSSIIDFGCGQGAAVNYFSKLGFNCVGLDANTNDLNVAKKNFSSISGSFFQAPLDTCEISNLLQYLNLEEQVDVITAFQSLYYLPEKQFNHFIKLAYDALKVGGIFFATMVSEKEELWFKNSRSISDDEREWMREVKFKSSRISLENYFIHFIKNEEDLIRKFSLFQPIHLGEYSNKFHKDDGSGHHFTFCGIKN